MLPHHAQAVHNDAVEGRGFSGRKVGQRLVRHGREQLEDLLRGD